jgi:hypothetical protein
MQTQFFFFKSLVRGRAVLLSTVEKKNPFVCEEMAEIAIEK